MTNFEPENYSIDPYSILNEDFVNYIIVHQLKEQIDLVYYAKEFDKQLFDALLLVLRYNSTANDYDAFIREEQ